MGGPGKLVDKMRRAGYMTVHEAARRAGVHATTIYRLIDSGTVGGLRIGRFRFVHAAQLGAYYPEPVRSMILSEAAA
jgi:excisionase family DNA binding protein